MSEAAPRRPGGGAGSGDEGFVRFVDVTKSYDQRTLVVKRFNLSVGRGEFVTLLGPSGSGKTTLLMMLAGFESVTGGEIMMDGKPITRVPPYRRDIGMVFQNYALFPHMTVGENLAYPLKIRKVGRGEVARQVAKYLDLVELGGYGDRVPARLSGGQRQRVALARALIFEPELVLMDEPLGALDRKLREQMQYEISRLHGALGCTVVYVTHDQSEALTMSDRVAVLDAGEVQQCATPAELYERPENAFVADFIGENNLIPGTVATVEEGTVGVWVDGVGEVSARPGDATEIGEPCIVSVRPEKVAIGAGSSGRDNEVPATFMVKHYVGDFVRYYYELAGGAEMRVKMLNDAAAPDPKRGETTLLTWRAGDCFAFRRR